MSHQQDYRRVHVAIELPGSGRNGNSGEQLTSERRLATHEKPSELVHTSNSKNSLSFEAIVKAFGAGIGIVYGTGYLIVFTFMGRLGIRDGDIFKAKYFWVGFLYWLIPILIGLPTFAWAGILFRWTQRDPIGRDLTKKPPMTLVGLLTGLQLLVLLYIVTLIAPPGFLSQRFAYIALNVTLTTLGLGLIYGCIRRLRSPETHRSANPFWRCLCYLDSVDWRFKRRKLYKTPEGWRVVRISVLVAVLIADVACLAPLGTLILELLTRARIPIAIFVFIGYTIYQFWGRVARALDPRDKSALWLVCGAMLISLYLFSAIGFAYAVYPFIPAERGGGNYIHSADVVLWVKSQSNIPDSFIAVREPKASRTKPLKLIEQTSSWVYVGSRPASDHPGAWKPQITAIRKDSIDSITFQVAVDPN